MPEDNGTGIPPETWDKLFQPFFTTKPTGEGTGLGLSISWDNITQQHGGAIEVDSRVGELTEFTIRLPRAHRAIIAAEAAEQCRSRQTHGLMTGRASVEHGDLSAPPVPPMLAHFGPLQTMSSCPVRSRGRRVGKPLIEKAFPG